MAAVATTEPYAPILFRDAHLAQGGLQSLSSGKLGFFRRSKATWAAPFDLDRLEMTGPETLILEGMQWDSRSSVAPFAFSDDGLLVYVPGADVNVGPKRSLVSGGAERLTRSVNNQMAHSCSPDGETVLFCGRNNERPFNLGRLSMAAGLTAEYLTDTEFREVVPLISPDGNWVAYASDETGQFEIYVSRFPNVKEGKRRISTDGNGGYSHVWGRDGSELFYRSSQAMMTVRIVQTEPAFEWEGPEIVFADRYFTQDYRYFDISPDGQRFLMMKESQSVERSSTQLVFVESWFEEFRDQQPGSQ